MLLLKTDTIERGANAVSISIPPLAITESGAWERNPKKRGYNAANGILNVFILAKFFVKLDFKHNTDHLFFIIFDLKPKKISKFGY